MARFDPGGTGLGSTGRKGTQLGRTSTEASRSSARQGGSVSCHLRGRTPRGTVHPHSVRRTQDQSAKLSGPPERGTYG